MDSDFEVPSRMLDLKSSMDDTHLGWDVRIYGITFEDFIRNGFFAAVLSDLSYTTSTSAEKD